VKNSLHAAIIPFDRYACPIRFGDCAKIVCRGSPANAFANGEQSGLIAVHRFVFLQPYANAFNRIFEDNDQAACNSAGGPFHIELSHFTGEIMLSSPLLTPTDQPSVLPIIGVEDQSQTIVEFVRGAGDQASRP
jgi:hypothetical protein